MNEMSDQQGVANAAPISAPPGAAEAEERNLAALLSDIAALEALAEHWPDEQRNAANARVKAVEQLNAEGFRRLIRQLKGHPALGPALREAATDELVYAVLRRHGILKPSLFERVEAALETIRPMLDNHGGDVELVSVEPPACEVRFLGACDGCPASQLTFYAGVKKAIQDHVPEIEEIRQVRGLGGGGDAGTVHFTSPFASYKSDSWSFVAKLGDLAEDETKVLDAGGHSLLVTRFADRVTIFENACAHMGMAMDGGDIADGRITCPYHGFEYSLESGECLTAPEVQLQPHGVRVVGDRIEVQLTS